MFAYDRPLSGQPVTDMALAGYDVLSKVSDIMSLARYSPEEVRQTLSDDLLKEAVAIREVAMTQEHRREGLKEGLDGLDYLKLPELNQRSAESLAVDLYKIIDEAGGAEIVEGLSEQTMKAIEASSESESAG